MSELIEMNINYLYDRYNELRKQSLPVNLNDLHSLDNLVCKLNHVLLNSGHATGISAIQVGVPLRVFIINMSRSSMPEIIALNPQIVLLSGRPQERYEGCLSLPNYHGKVKRRNKIEFSAYNLKGVCMSYKYSGYAAAVIQHEFDHLDGILYWDRMEPNTVPQKRNAEQS